MNNLKKNTPDEYASSTHLEEQLAEHNTAIELIKQELRAEFIHMKESIDSLSAQFQEFRRELMQQYTTREQHLSLKKDVDELVALKNWAMRIVVGAIIVGLLALLGIRQ